MAELGFAQGLAPETLELILEAAEDLGMAQSPLECRTLALRSVFPVLQDQTKALLPAHATSRNSSSMGDLQEWP